MDPTSADAYYQVAVTILIGVVVVVVVQLRDMGLQIREEGGNLLHRLSLVLFAAVTLVSVVAIVETLGALRGIDSWATTPRNLELITTILVGFAIGPRILATLLYAVSPRRRTAAPPRTIATQPPPRPRARAGRRSRRWIVALAVFACILRRRK
jgi:hypothetical protein